MKSTQDPTKATLTAGMHTSWDPAARRDLEYVACFGKTQTVAAKPVAGCDGWRRVVITIDSGAAESVADPRAFPGYDVKNHSQPILYQSATGQSITFVGEHVIALITADGSLRGMTLQAADKTQQPCPILY